MVSTICCVHTILRDGSLSFKMGLPGAYVPTAKIALGCPYGEASATPGVEVI